VFQLDRRHFKDPALESERVDVVALTADVEASLWRIRQRERVGK
jgi:hypothetical protein